MASTRKLQGEIDRVLKQITEHMQEFDQIWQKVHSAPTPNLKEKYEGDLKKEIKKLQRFRDQLKSWAANSDIKNKKPLLDARKAIENEMERFKVLEKETKTKAYSKEGLSGHGRGGRGRSGSSDSNQQDPREDPAKRDTFVWLDNIEESLADQLAELEEKADTLRANSKKKKSSGADQLLDELTHKCERHQWHIDTLQTIKDRLEHDELAVALVEDIRDDLEYYLNSNQEADFQEDETLYDALELDKEVERLESRDDDEAAELADEGDIVPDADGSAAAEEEDAPAEEDDESEERGTVSAILKSAGAKSTPTKAKATTTAAKAAGGKAAAAPAASPLSAAAVVKGRSNSNASAGPTPVVPTPSPSAAAGKGESLASILMKQKQAAAAAAAPSPSSSPSPSAAGAAKVGAKATAAGPAGPQPVSAASLDQFMADAKKMATKPAGAPVQGPTGQQQQPGKSLPPGVMPSIAPAQLGRLPPGTKPPGTQQSPAVQPMMPPPGLSSQTPPPGLGLGTGVGGAGSGSAAEMSGLPPSSLLSSSANTGASGAPIGVKDRTLVPDDYLLTLSLMEPSLRNLPDPFDSERPKQYVPRNPYRTPSYFPSLPAPIFDDPALFDKLSVDTLFFIFYFQQGTPHQYLAARELKKQSWRYHKNFLTWFQRHDDPKITTEEFEQGTYVYFDYESGWCQRIKADFTFEYRHLEDELAVPLAATL